MFDQFECVGTDWILPSSWVTKAEGKFGFGKSANHLPGATCDCSVQYTCSEWNGRHYLFHHCEADLYTGQGPSNMIRFRLIIFCDDSQYLYRRWNPTSEVGRMKVGAYHIFVLIRNTRDSEQGSNSILPKSCSNIPFDVSIWPSKNPGTTLEVA